MCGRYFVSEDDLYDVYIEVLNELQRKYDNEKKSKIKFSGEIFPTDTVPVLANNKNMQLTPFAMKWGYSESWANRPLFNARSETASTKHVFKNDMKKHRCLVPASYYFEWQKVGKKKIKYAISLNKSKIIYMAGIYRIEDDSPVFSILTRNVAPSISFIHDRMPVILPETVHKDWLNIDNDANKVIESACLDMKYRTT